MTLEALAAVSARAPVGGWPRGAPERDYTRSPAAARVGALAAAESLFLFHFEHRFELDLPESWVEPGADPEAPRWVDGVLPERKYQSFRHDLPIGSFHPGHRGKWTTHELCHALVGFGWKPGASRFFHATAARLAELLPVVLYYFLDEVGLRRCPRHQGAGALYRSFCPACEALAAARPLEARDADLLAEGRRFLDRELAAVAQTRRLGVPQPHLHGTLDLCSDGLAYARAHHRRLSSAATERMTAFFGGGWHRSLDDLEARVVEVAAAVVDGAPLSPIGGSEDHWRRQDVAYRILTVWEETDGDARNEVDALVGDLAAGLDLGAAVERWGLLEASYVLPDVEQVFSVGYALPGHGGRHLGQVGEGLASAAPLTLAAAEDVAVDLVSAFAPADLAVREPLVVRFARWMRAEHPSLAELTTLEAAIRTVRLDPELAALGSGAPARLAEGAVVVRGSRDLLATADAIEAGSAVVELRDGCIVVAAVDAPWALVVGRAPDGEVILAEVDPDVADALAQGGVPEDPGAREALVELGLLRPARWLEDLG